MKFTVTKENIINGLQIVQNIVSTRTTLPILSNVLVRATPGQLQLTTTDLDIGVRCSIPAEVSKPGVTTLPVRRLFSILRELSSSEIEISVDEKNASSISAGSSFFKILGLPEEEFPPLPKLEGKKSFKLGQTLLRSSLRKTSYAISIDETRYVLNGIFFSFKADKLTLVATDGRRLALVETDLEFPKENEVEVILPTKTVNELNRLLADKGEVEIFIGENQVLFKFIPADTSKEGSGQQPVQELLLVSKLIEGNFPNYRQVIPAESKERITIEREIFLSAIHRVSLLTSDKSNSVKLNFSRNNLNITANTPEVGEAKETIAINYGGKEFSIAFNPEYLMDPLRNLDNDEIFLELSDELSPGVVKINSPFLYVLMPMRIS